MNNNYIDYYIALFVALLLFIVIVRFITINYVVFYFRWGGLENVTVLSLSLPPSLSLSLSIYIYIYIRNIIGGNPKCPFLLGLVYFVKAN